nr:glycosyltransferase [bacterium]
MTVTFLVPAFNAESTIVSTLQSILAQDAPDVRYRIIVVDDGSTDSTRDLVREFAALNPAM